MKRAWLLAAFLGGCAIDEAELDRKIRWLELRRAAGGPREGP